MNEVINSINQVLPNSPAGEWEWERDGRPPMSGDPTGAWVSGEKARVLRMWIRSVLYMINRYEAEHQRLLDDAATTLQLALPQDIVRGNIFPFLALPSHTIDGENHQAEVGDGDEEGVDEDENEVGRGNHLEEDGEDEQEVDEVGRDNHLGGDGQGDVEELDNGPKENEVSPPGIILIEILLFYWLVAWGSFSMMRGMPFASPVLVSALVIWQVRK